MLVEEIMTKNPACCTAETSLQEVAQMMVEHDCGCIPVVENGETKEPIGVITDRDITIRTVAKGKNPLDLYASDVMSGNIVTITPDTTVEECCNLMESDQIRRVLVVDGNGACCGIVAQADVAINAPTHKTAEVVQEVSKGAST